MRTFGGRESRALIGPGGLTDPKSLAIRPFPATITRLCAQGGGLPGATVIENLEVS